MTLPNGEAQPARAQSTRAELDLLLELFLRAVPDAWHVVAVSADGLALSASPGLSADCVDQLAAITGGLSGLANGAAQCVSAGQVRCAVIDMDDMTLLLAEIPGSGHLAVLTAPCCDLGQVWHEIVLLGRDLGAALSSPARSA